MWKNQTISMDTVTSPSLNTVPDRLIPGLLYDAVSLMQYDAGSDENKK